LFVYFFDTRAVFVRDIRLLLNDFLIRDAVSPFCPDFFLPWIFDRGPDVENGLFAFHVDRTLEHSLPEERRAFWNTFGLFPFTPLHAPAQFSGRALLLEAPFKAPLMRAGWVPARDLRCLRSWRRVNLNFLSSPSRDDSPSDMLGDGEARRDAV